MSALDFVKDAEDALSSVRYALEEEEAREPTTRPLQLKGQVETDPGMFPKFKEKKWTATKNEIVRKKDGLTVRIGDMVLVKGSRSKNKPDWHWERLREIDISDNRPTEIITTCDTAWGVGHYLKNCRVDTSSVIIAEARIQTLSDRLTEAEEVIRLSDETVQELHRMRLITGNRTLRDRHDEYNLALTAYRTKHPPTQSSQSSHSSLG